MAGGDRVVAVAGDAPLEAVADEAGDGSGLVRCDAEEEGEVGRSILSLLQAIEPSQTFSRANALLGENRPPLAWREVVLVKCVRCQTVLGLVYASVCQ